MSDIPFFIKICVIGSPYDLKNKFLRRFGVPKFDKNYLPTLGMDLITNNIEINGKNIILIIVDTAGQEFFGKLRPSYYRGASAAVITFDKANKSSFLHVEDWLAEFRKHMPDPQIPIALVGFITNTEEVSTEMGQQLATQLKLDYYETTVTNGQMAEQIFGNLCRVILNEPSY
jgi:small GTP-binding protein